MDLPDSSLETIVDFAVLSDFIAETSALWPVIFKTKKAAWCKKQYKIFVDMH